MKRVLINGSFVNVPDEASNEFIQSLIKEKEVEAVNEQIPLKEKLVFVDGELTQMPTPLRETLVPLEIQKAQEPKPVPPEPTKSILPSMEWDKRELLQYAADHDVKGLIANMTKQTILFKMGFKVDAADTL